MAEMSAIFREAAQALDNPARPPGPEAAELLGWLGCGRDDLSAVEAGRHARLLRAAAGFHRFFRLTSEAAPGLACFGAEIDPAMVMAMPGLPAIGVAGCGRTPLEAFQRCVGEGIERLACMENVADPAFYQPPPPQPEAWLDALAAVTDWLPARRLAGDGGEVLLPVEIARWRPRDRQQTPPPFLASLGCAAGPDIEAAMLSGLCEVMERDAAALWWHGGQRGRPLPMEAVAGAVALLDHIRGGARRPRHSWLLDITSDLGIPAIAAISCAPDGGGVCIGTAAHPRRDRAMQGAIREMALNELAVQLAQAKRDARGEGALNAGDHAHLARSAGLHAARHPILHPHGAPLPDSAAADPALAWLLEKLAAAGQEVLALDLTRPALGVPVVRMFCPGLEPLPSQRAGPRLQAAIAGNGTDCRVSGISLM